MVSLSHKFKQISINVNHMSNHCILSGRSISIFQGGDDFEMFLDSLIGSPRTFNRIQAKRPDLFSNALQNINHSSVPS